MQHSQLLVDTNLTDTLSEAEVFDLVYLIFSKHNSHLCMQMTALIKRLYRMHEQEEFSNFYEFLFFSEMDWRTTISLHSKFSHHGKKTKINTH